MKHKLLYRRLPRSLHFKAKLLAERVTLFPEQERIYDYHALEIEARRSNVHKMIRVERPVRLALVRPAPSEGTDGSLNSVQQKTIVFD